MMKIGVVMDPIEAISVKKDSTFAMMLAAQKRGWEVHYILMEDMSMQQGEPYARTHSVTVMDNPDHWYQIDQTQTLALREFDAILMRKDPPFDTEYIYATYMLERAEEAGVLIVNKPQSLRDCNEKLYTAWFPEHTPTTLVTRRADEIKAFQAEHGDVILKPLDGMGGASIFRVKQGDPNLSVIIETLTEHGQRFCMAQTFVPDISNGDKRILIVDGEPVPYCLARIPADGETRGNLAAGGRGEARPLSETDWTIARAIAPTLKEKGLIFVGLDVIGDKLTEINVTSPTCIREIDAAYDISIGDILMEAIARRCA
ncbi:MULTISPECIES: glutathione synthase [Salinivibrio]|uniref:Glutathione synthetase n=1 Tax=Salinivibrio siamensis TaxID=414286 RepID=A0ABX3K6D5_9GAMM|nr:MULTISPECIES: glutathione synthase [Salinivibrio]KKA44249.1 glutathione synthetase [Salinivibrio sp. KP-1]MPS33220.1 glutathione synthase [Salinivibrio sp. VYel7]MPX91311.1 glutathione synthase [Salinivibrio sp. VYel1]MPX94605.1 glutathione synthase [Salinivibrio sp. VYel9]MPY00892.1 glutathione synthase [Salinivibrio sp. VYel4]